MAPSDVHGQTTRRPEEERDGSISGRLAASACAGCQQWRSSGKLTSPIAFRKGPARSESRADPQRDGKSPAGRGRTAAPLGRATAPRGLTGPPWLLSRCSRPRRTLAVADGGADGAGVALTRPCPAL